MSVAAGHHQAGTLPVEPPVEMHPVEVVIRPTMTLSRALDLWLDDLERRDYSAITIRDYGRYLGLLCDTLPPDTDVSKITLEQHISPFLRRYRHRSKSTKATAETAICSCFGWLRLQGKITKNPTEMLVRTRRTASEDLDVVTVSADEVRRLLAAADGWPERLAINVLVYLGPRKNAVSQLRISDYDSARGRIRFREKGNKTIYKPIPDELGALIEQAIEAGVYATQDYLVPSLRPECVTRPERANQLIWRIVKRVADRAGVVTHVHALRAAFACFYLEETDGDVLGLREVMGHRHLATTEIYLRKMNKQKAMEPVRKLSWAVAELDTDLVSEVRNVRDSQSDAEPVGTREHVIVREVSDRMGKGLAPNGRDEWSA